MNYRQTKKMVKKACPDVQIKSKEFVYSAKKAMYLLSILRSKYT